MEYKLRKLGSAKNTSSPWRIEVTSIPRWYNFWNKRTTNVYSSSNGIVWFNETELSSGVSLDLHILLQNFVWEVKNENKG